MAAAGWQTLAVQTLHTPPLGQSVAVLQPQVPPGKQTEPLWVVGQLTHGAPVAPQAALVVLLTQVLVLVLQQPPLQG